MDLDDSREIRVNSGQVIGLIMLLLAMLPRDIRSDLFQRQLETEGWFLKGRVLKKK